MSNCKTCLHAAVCAKRIATGGHVKDCKNFVEKKQGRWEPRTDAFGFVRCSVCHDCNIYDDWPDGKKWNYCPQCGADMRGAGHE